MRKNTYASVVIEHDMSYADRVMSKKFRTLLRSMKDQNLSRRRSRDVPREKLEAVVSLTHTRQGSANGNTGRTGTADVFVATVALPAAMTCVAVEKARVWAAAASVDAAVVVMGRVTMVDRRVVVAVHGTVDPAEATTTTNVIITGEITLAIRFPPGFGTFEGGIKTVTQTII